MFMSHPIVTKNVCFLTIGLLRGSMYTLVIIFACNAINILFVTDSSQPTINLTSDKTIEH